MDIEKFITDLAEQFEDTDPNEITEKTKFQELDEWDSLMALNIIALAKTSYGKRITGKEIRSCLTVKDLFDLVVSK